MKRNALGILLIVLPIPLVVTTLTAYVMVHFIVSSTAGPVGAPVIGLVINTALQIVGLVGFSGIISGIPIGIYLVATEGKKSEQRSVTK